MKLPEHFYWGTATAAHQVEGGNRNDWSEFERQSANRLSQIARRREWPEYILKNYPNPLQEENYISGRACDHYNRFREDFDIAKSLGHNAHRFSIEWSRVEPEEGKFDEKGIEHYREVIQALRERGMEPFVSLWHWTLPLWVREQGGWENEKTIQDFLAYVAQLSDAFGHSVRFWMPVNEPTVYAGHAYILGVFPPGVKSYARANRVIKNLVKAHKHAYDLLHTRFGNAVMVGSAHNLHSHQPYRSWWPPDMLAAKLLRYVRDTRHLGWLKNHQDFIGLNYYYRDKIKFVGWGGRFGAIDIKNPNENISDMGWEIYPEGIFHLLKNLQKFKKPIYITENGVADARDVQRARFIREHLEWVQKALAEGVDVRGYFHWSLLDNFEWDKGFWPRFGLVEVDYKTMERRIRPSAWEYKRFIEEGI